MKLIAGLGNPGSGYRNTRHNVGFVILDELAERLGVTFSKEKFKALIADAQLRTDKLLLMKPMTYMNASGESVALAARNKVNDPEDVLIVYDDAELPLGTLRMKASGSAGTHNGMKSVLERLGVREVPRLRVGIGEKTTAADLSDHVLGKFRPDEREEVEAMVTRACDAILLWIESGITDAMNEYN